MPMMMNVIIEWALKTLGKMSLPVVIVRLDNPRVAVPHQVAMFLCSFNVPQERLDGFFKLITNRTYNVTVSPEPSGRVDH
jgi:hypothetical protein